MSDILVLRRIKTSYGDAAARSYPKESAEADNLTHAGLIRLTAGTGSVYTDNNTTQVDMATGTGVTVINIGTSTTPAKTITIGADADDATVINGDLTITGNTTSVSTTNLAVTDNLIFLNSGGVATDSGIAIDRGGTDDAVILWEEGADRFELGQADTADGVTAPSAIATGSFFPLGIGNALTLDNGGAGTDTITTTSGESLTITATGATSDITLASRSGTITVSEAGNTALSGFTATSIIGAINENAASIAASGSTLQQAYTASSAPSTITTDATNDEFIVGGTAGLRVTGTGADNVSDSGFGFVVDTTGAYKIFADAASELRTTAANLTLTTETSGALTLTSAGLVDVDAVGVVSINSSAGAINVGNDAVAQAINVGTGAAARTITIGNATGATLVDIDAGTGGFDLDTTGVIAMNATGTGASNLTSGGNLSLAAGGITGALAMTSPGTISITNAAGSTIGITAQSILTLGSTTGGTNIDAGDDSTVNVAGDYTVLLDETQVGDSVAAGNAYALTSGIGAATTGVAAGGIGGAVTITSGAGGAGSATGVAGAGGDACLVAGEAGSAGLGGPGQIGRVCFTSGSTEYFLTAAATTAAPALATTAQDIIGAINEIDGAVGSSSLNAAYLIGNTIQMTDAAGNFDVSNLSGTNAISLDANEASNFTVDSAGLVLSTTTSGAIDIDGAGITSINSLAAINVGDDAVAQAINIGTGAAARTITIGNAASTEVQVDAITVDINAGGGGIQIDTTDAFSIDGATGSNITVTGSGEALELFVAGGGTNVLSLNSAGTGANAIDINATAGGVDVDAAGAITLDSATASNFTVSGATADLTLGARAATITLNETGDTTLSGFTAISIVGALNELKSDVGGAAGDLQNTYTAAVALAAGEAVYISAANTVNKANATADNDAAHFLGVAEAIIGAASTGLITSEGIAPIQFIGGLTVAAGEEIYLSATAGHVTNVAPGTSGNVELSIGFVKDTTGLSATTVLGETGIVHLVRGPKMLV